VTIIGPGAGSIQTGQGLLADVLACVQEKVQRLGIAVL